MKCIYCGSKHFNSIYKGYPFEILRCGECDLGFLNPLPKEKFLDNFYSKRYFKKSEGTYGYQDYKEMKHSLDNESLRKVKFVKLFRKSGNLLDVGAGLGNFAATAKKHHYQIKVLDRSGWAVSTIKKEFGIDGYVSDLTRPIGKNKFGIITGWDVIEHLADIGKSFKCLNQTMVNGGLLFITTPNLNSLDAKILMKYWYGFKKIPEHVLYFSPKSIQRVANDAGFKVVEIKNWGFVRNLNFIAVKLAVYNKLAGRLFNGVIKILNIGSINIYFPLIDMMVVLKKVKDVK